jgi:hypothetical protein
MKRRESRDSFRNHFRDKYILPLSSQYIYSLMIFVVKNSEIFDTDKVHYKINTRRIMEIHVIHVNLALYGKGVYYMAIRI